MRDEARPVERARLACGESFADHEPRRRALVQEPRDKRQREPHRRRPVRGLSRGDLMQGVVRQPSAERRIERARQRQAARGALARRAALEPRFERRRGANAPSPPPCRPATFGPIL